MTVPEAPELRINNKTDNVYAQKFDKAYLNKLKSIEHTNFVKKLVDKKDHVKLEKVPYSDAVNSLHDQLYSLDLEDFASKIKVKKRIY